MIRHVEAGQGPPLVHLQEGAPRLTPADERLSRRFRVLALETPASGEAVSSVLAAITELGLDAVDLIGTAGAAAVALDLALEAPERVRGLVLESPATLRTDADRERRLRASPTPTLVLFGTRDDAAVQATGRLYKALMPNAHLVFVYDAAQAIGIERPAAFAEVVIDFLERHEAFVIRRTESVIHP